MLPSASDETQATAAFYDAAALRYDGEVDRSDLSHREREVFRELVSRLAGAARPLLDFGCGTGKDAEWYATHGHQVIAYDISSGMVDELRKRCASLIAAGTVMPLAGDFHVLRAHLAKAKPIAAVAANFAVLNHVRDLRSLFDELASFLAPGGVIVAKLLNPFYWRDVTRRWWWKGVPGSLRTGSIRVVGGVTTYRHFPGAVRAAAEPTFDVIAYGSPMDTRAGAYGRLLWKHRAVLVILRKRS